MAETLRQKAAMPMDSGNQETRAPVSGQAYFFEDFGAVICYNAFRCSFACIPECAEEQQQAGYEDKVRRGCRYFSCLYRHSLRQPGNYREQDMSGRAGCAGIQGAWGRVCIGVCETRQG